MVCRIIRNFPDTILPPTKTYHRKAQFVDATFDIVHAARPPRSNQPKLDAMADKIKQMRQDGVPYSKISKEIDVSVNALQKWCRKNKVTAPKRVTGNSIKRVLELKGKGYTNKMIAEQVGLPYDTVKYIYQQYRKDKDEVQD